MRLRLLTMPVGTISSVSFRMLTIVLMGNWLKISRHRLRRRPPPALAS
jgi:hypothetical protein